MTTIGLQRRTMTQRMTTIRESTFEEAKILRQHAASLWYKTQISDEGLQP